MLSHVHVGVSDFARGYAFYAGIMEELGYALKFSKPDKSWAGWMQAGVARPLFLVGRPYDGKAATPGNGQMVALLAPDRSIVDRCYTRAISSGGQDEGAPALRPHYHPDYYGCYFRDPDGNKICVCCHDPISDGCDNEFWPSSADEYWPTSRCVTGWPGPRPRPAG